MRRRLVVCLQWIAVLSVAYPTWSAAEELRADFITGTFASEGRCAMVAALDAGGPRNVETVPETLAAAGFESWEGGCTFEKIIEKAKGRVYLTTMRCHEGPEEWTETNTFTVESDGVVLLVETDGETMRFERCGREQGN